MNPLGRVVSTRRSTRDDIPVARRSKPAPRRRGSGFGLFLACLSLGLGIPAAVWLGPGLLARRSFLLSSDTVPAVEGIEAPPDQDGRLLGHFPYEEAIVSQLVPVEAGIEFIYHMREHLVDVTVATVYGLVVFAIVLWLKKKFSS